MRRGWSAKERPSRAWRERGRGERLDLSCFTRVCGSGRVDLSCLTRVRGSEGAQVLTKPSGAVRLGWSAKERPSRAWGEGEGEARSVVFSEGLRLWEARFVLFYEGIRLWEVHLCVFYVSGRLSGGTMSRGSMRLSGSAKESPSRAWGEGEGGAGII